MTEIFSFVVEEGVDLKAVKLLPKLKRLLAEITLRKNVCEKNFPFLKIRNDGCWEWLRGKNQSGYGMVTPKHNHKRLRTHRLFYEKLIKKIPTGLQIDHLCRNRICCNPNHLEPVTLIENVRRGLVGIKRTHCIRGHEFLKNSFYIIQNSRRCKLCHKSKMKTYLNTKKYKLWYSNWYPKYYEKQKNKKHSL